MSFSVRRGEVHAICGENGAGKSTLMKVVSGVYPQDSGEIFMDGKKITIKNPNDAFDQGIAIMYQETSLFNEMTILENMFLNHEIVKKVGPIPVLDFKAMEERVSAIFQKMNVVLDLRLYLAAGGTAGFFSVQNIINVMRVSPSKSSACSGATRSRFWTTCG